MLGLVVVYGGCFAVPVHVLHRRDIRLWQACESKLCNPLLDAAHRSDNVNLLASHDGMSCLLSLGQFLVTSLFAAALVFAVHARATPREVQKQAKSKVTIQQNAPTATGEHASPTTLAARGAVWSGQVAQDRIG